MADTPVPSPGYGNTSEVSLDTYNQWQRSQPWYIALIKSFGQDPNNVHLNDQQKQAVVRAAQAHGAVIDEGTNGQEVDDSGNLRGVGHKLRNTLIVAGIAAAALATAGAAGAFGGAAAGGASGAGAAGAGTAAGLGGVEAGATAGLGALALPGAGTALSGAAAGILPSAATIAGSGALPTGVTSSLAGGTAGSSGLSKILSTASDLAGPLSSIASGRAAGAQAEAGIGERYDQNAINLYRAQQGATDAENTFDLGRGNLALGQSNAANNFGLNRGSLANTNAATDLAQRNFALAAPGKRAGNAVRGDILSNAQDVAFSGLPSNIPVPTISGGLRPSMFSADTRALGKDITSQARAAQAKGDTFAPLPDLPTYQAPEGGLPTYKAGPAAPTLTGLPSGGATSTIGNTSSILGLAPAFADIWRRYQAK